MPAPRLGMPSAPAITFPVASPAGADDAGASLDDADALPAVGKVWDAGPRRSLSSMFAAAKPKEPQAAGAAPAASPELLAQWQTVLQSVSDQMGPAVHVPLVSGEPRRQNGTFVIRFTGPFATMARLLEKYKDQIQQTICQVTGEALGLVLEVDASAPPPKVLPQVQPAAGAASTGPAAASVMVTPPKEGIPLTPELRAQLEKDPLIRSVLEGFNGNIVKVE